MGPWFSCPYILASGISLGKYWQSYELSMQVLRLLACRAFSVRFDKVLINSCMVYLNSHSRLYEPLIDCLMP